MSSWSMFAWSSDASRSSRHIFLLSEGCRAPTFAQRWAIYWWIYSTRPALQEREIATSTLKKASQWYVVCQDCSTATAPSLPRCAQGAGDDFLILPTLLKSVIYLLPEIERRLRLTRKKLATTWKLVLWVLKSRSRIRAHSEHSRQKFPWTSVNTSLAFSSIYQQALYTTIN